MCLQSAKISAGTGAGDMGDIDRVFKKHRSNSLSSHAASAGPISLSPKVLRPGYCDPAPEPKHSIAGLPMLPFSRSTSGQRTWPTYAHSNRHIGGNRRCGH